jgi:hypothetical protein
MDDCTNDRSVCIVSEWAASQLAMKGGPDLVKNLAAVARDEDDLDLNSNQRLLLSHSISFIQACGNSISKDSTNQHLCL